MRKYLFLFLIFISSFAAASAQSARTPLPQVAPQDTLAVFPAFSGTGNTGALGVATFYPGGYSGTNPGVQAVYSPKYFTVQAFTSGSPTGCSYHVYGTLKLTTDNPVYPADYQDLTGALDCTGTTVANMFTSVYYKPVSTVVIVLSTLSGGTSPTAQFRVLVAH